MDVCTRGCSFCKGFEESCENSPNHWDWDGDDYHGGPRELDPLFVLAHAEEI